MRPPARSGWLSPLVVAALAAGLVLGVIGSPRAARVELVGDFNAWRTGATRLERDAQSGAWAAQVAMSRGRHRYAFVVDDTQWVADTAAPAALAANGRPASRFVVPNQD